MTDFEKFNDFSTEKDYEESMSNSESDIDIDHKLTSMIKNYFKIF